MDPNEGGLLPSGLGAARTVSSLAKAADSRQADPQPLWALAVRLAKTHGVSRTATALGLDYYSLKKRADARATATVVGRSHVCRVHHSGIGRQAVSV